MFSITLGMDKDGKFSISTENIKKEKKVRNKGKSLLELPSSYTIVDIETTGLYPAYDEIIEIGALKVKDDEIVDTFESLIYCDEIDEFITDLTGITTEMTLVAPKIDIVLNEFLDFLKDDIIIAHNANFDVNFIYDAVESHMDKEFNNDFIDTLRISRKAYSEFKTHRLKHLTKALDLKNQPSHRSISDCQTTLELYLKCKEKITSENIDLNSSYSSYKPSDIKVEEGAVFDEENPLFNKNCIFTGSLEKMVRKEAMQAVINLGGTVGNGVTKKTDYLIVGIQDYARFVDGKESSKTKRAKTLIEGGQDLRIISENEFYEIIFGITIVD